MKNTSSYNTAFKNKFGDCDIKKLLICKGDFNNLMKIMSEERAFKKVQTGHVTSSESTWCNINFTYLTADAGVCYTSVT